jgi:hypothetical protein
METHMKKTRQKHTHIIKQTTKMINKEKYSRNRGIDLSTKTLMSKKTQKRNSPFSHLRLWARSTWN